MTETYKVNGVDVAELLTRVQLLDGWRAAPPLRQSDFPVPGRIGDVPANPWPGPRAASVGGLISAATRDACLAKISRFMRVVFNAGQLMTLSRTAVDSTGALVACETTARYADGLGRYEHVSPTIARIAAELTILESYWYAANTVDSGVKTGTTFSIDAPGDVATHKVVVRFTGSATTQRLTNTTTGDWVEYGASSTAAAVVLDVDAFTAVQGATNRIQYVSSGDSNSSYYWMTIAPGINTFTLTGGGSVQLTYRAAYL